jgi:starch phosphorylase
MNNQKKVAYFCMEYGLDKKLPLYAGGLGILAGDYLKAAKDLNKPVVGIGIRWWQDYTNQYIDQNGYPYDTFPTHDLDFIEDTGITIDVMVENKTITCTVHKVTEFNNMPLYLLDTGHPESENGWITDRLYDGDDHKRIAQEIVLGIGGIKLLRKLNINIKKYHFNEGHAAFAGLELIKEKMQKDNLGFNEALNQTKDDIIFTTHTPVEAGNESHDLGLLEKLGAIDGLRRENIVQIGGEPFNMTAACLHMSHLANGVSELHGETARNMWKDLPNSAPIIAITNGVHQKTWQNDGVKKAYKNQSKLWQAHMQAKQNLINFIEKHTDAKMNPDNIIVGFARRAAPYKRSELIFRDSKQIKEFLTDGKLQLVFSGKAHPDDHYGKDIVSTLVKMDQKYRDSVVFLENYNIEIAKYLTQGCDVWLNNPRRPLEASGTSGMKAALNGVLNLSVLDGWVAEGVEHGRHGWILDEMFTELNDSLGEDEKDLKALYKILREEVIPIYYNNKKQWIKMMKASIKMANKDFSATRMLEDYYSRMYNKEREKTLV